MVAPRRTTQMNADEVTAAAAKPPAASAKPASLLRTVWDFLMNRPDDDDPKQKAAKVTGLVTLLATFLGLAIVTWTAQSSGVKGAWGIAFLWGLASFATGAVLGFLFGIPKVLQDDTKKTG